MTISNTKLSAILATASPLRPNHRRPKLRLIRRCPLFPISRSKFQNIPNSASFRNWWPYGRDLMLPLLFSSVISNIVAYRMTNDDKFAIGAMLLGCIGPYTGIVLKEDIEKLRSESCEEVKETRRGFVDCIILGW